MGHWNIGRGGRLRDMETVSVSRRSSIRRFKASSSQGGTPAAREREDLKNFYLAGCLSTLCQEQRENRIRKETTCLCIVSVNGAN
jgi:hypothetical protein